jgi:hypothetical protein
MTLPLHLNKDGIVDGFKYSWRYCARNILGICASWKLHTEVFLFEDKEAMKTFHDMDLVLGKRPRP